MKNEYMIRCDADAMQMTIADGVTTEPVVNLLSSKQMTNAATT